MTIDLSRTPFAEVLWSASAAHRSGDLIVDAGGSARTAYFDQGRLVSASSEDPKQRLGAFLVESGRVSRAELSRAEERIGDGRTRRIGEALVAAGLLRRDEVGRAVARLVRQIILGVFPATQGQARFEEGEPSVPVEAMVGVSLHRLLYVGIRSMRDAELIQAGIGDLDRSVRLTAAPPFRFVLRKCPPGELRILEQVRQPVPIRRLVTEHGKLSAARLKAVYALHASGVIEDVAAGGAPTLQPVAHIESNTFLLAEALDPEGPPENASLRLEVEQELAFSSRLDTATWIRVSSREDVVTALEAKRRRYLGFLERIAEDATLQRDVEALIGRITVILLQLADTASPGRIPTAATQTVPPLVRLPAATGDPPMDAEPKRRVVPRSGDTGPVRRVEAGSGPRPRAEPAAAPDASGSGEGRGAEPQEPISQLLRNGELRMSLNDFASATQIYRRLVERAPEVAGYRMRLALAMARWPPSAREAEREFLEAIRRDPNNPRIHYHFGLYYRSLKLRSRATEEMRTAVALDPQNAGAREHLRQLSPNDPLLDDQSWGD